MSHLSESLLASRTVANNAVTNRAINSYLPELEAPLFDTHCHLDFAVFQDDFNAHLKLAHQQSVQRVLIPSIGPGNWNEIEQLVNQQLVDQSQSNQKQSNKKLVNKAPQIYYALGFHPVFLNNDLQNKQQSVTQLTGQLSTQLINQLDKRLPQCVAIGESGLDFSEPLISSNEQFSVQQVIDQQETALTIQLDLAKQYHLPIIIHSRQSHNRLIQMVKGARLTHGGVVHGFSGSYQQALEWLRLGFKIGVGGTITYPRAKKTRQTIQKLPLDSLLLETDAPDMPIVGYQGQANHPKYLPIILKELSLLRKIETNILAFQIWKNSNQLFSICD